MAKSIREERLAIVFTLTRVGGTGLIKVICRADYEVTSEDLVVTRSFEPTLTPAQENTAKTFGTDILSQIKDKEGVI